MPVRQAARAGEVRLAIGKLGTVHLTPAQLSMLSINRVEELLPWQVAHRLTQPLTHAA